MDSDLHCITNEFPNHPFYQLYLDRPNTFDIFNVKHQNANIEPAMSFQRIVQFSSKNHKFAYTIVY